MTVSTTTTRNGGSMRLLALLLLLPSLASAQGLTTLAPGQTGGGKVLWQAPFGTPGCYADGVGGVSFSKTTSGIDTKAQSYTDANGDVQSCSVANYRVDRYGIMVEPERLNFAKTSITLSAANTISSPWTAGGVTITTMGASGVAGGNWTQGASTTNTSVIYALLTPQTSTQFAGSAYVATASGTQAVEVGLYVSGGTVSACTCAVEGGGSCTTAQPSAGRCHARVTATTTKQRLIAYATYGSGSSSVYLYFSPGVYGTSTGTAMVSGMQLENAHPATSYIPTGAGDTARREADMVQMAIPWATDWCVQADATPPAGSAWGGTERIWSFGPDGADSVNLTRAATLTITDASSGVKSVASASTPAAGTHRFLACAKGGVPSLKTDGTPGAAPSGAGTGVLTNAPAFLYPGGSSVTGAQSGMMIKGLKVCAGVCK